MKTFLLLVSALFLFSSAEPTNLLKPTNKVESWRLDLIEAGKAEIKADDDSILIQVTAIDSTDWHVQAVQTDLDLKDGSSYTLKFKGRSPDKLTITVNAMIDQEDWHQIGLQEEVSLGKEYKDFSFDFTANSTLTKKNRISFVLGNGKGQIQLKDVTLTAK